ncbi:hypothetical protein, unlikely [Trypanosoma brucei gambiense DAL972]|uniref:Uncharacterized protein n=1 Tax=Trypanosoma brucei gambiense (strain MHOM/CI/86/DAL972) TaxID=679716 RepID=C9ZSH5_TRYB9|nr:hypothetical protein, unlikely [Trypanosoma brucei gambiense DAL972]CBH12359.1 hypothetical protein, unlikely [Trypanosoma brucei gambiense DAL972]|eukprot:XP_011774640.1 hypothetical protein, unlikely [Trypanosoma brucei gambiense DAL972]
MVHSKALPPFLRVCGSATDCLRCPIPLTRFVHFLVIVVFRNLFLHLRGNSACGSVWIVTAPSFSSPAGVVRDFPVVRNIFLCGRVTWCRVWGHWYPLTCAFYVCIAAFFFF